MRPTFVLKTPPAREPIGLDDVKAHSRISIDADDLLIQSQILAVRQWFERIYDVAIITQTWTMYLDYLPCRLEIYKVPIIKINSIKYYDDASVLQTLASNQYTIDLNKRPPQVVPALNMSWPYVQWRPSAVAVEFDAGYGPTVGDVPPNVIQYLLMKVADIYENRESYSESGLETWDFTPSLVAPERLFSF